MIQPVSYKLNPVARILTFLFDKYVQLSSFEEHIELTTSLGKKITINVST